MKICIPTETNEGLTAQIYGHFGSAPFFTIYDTATGKVAVTENSNTHHAHGTCQPLSVLGAGIDAVVCRGLGARAVQKLNEAKIRAYQTEVLSVAEAVDAFSEGGASEITIEKACTQHDCH